MGGTNSKNSNIDSTVMKRVVFVKARLSELKKEDKIKHDELLRHINRTVPPRVSRRVPGKYGGSNTNTTNCTKDIMPFVLKFDENVTLELTLSCKSLYYEGTMIGSLNDILSNERNQSSDLQIEFNDQFAYISLEKLDDLLNEIEKINAKNDAAETPIGGKGKKVGSTRIEKWVSTGRKVTIQVGSGSKSSTVKTVYMNAATKELRVRKLFVAKNGLRKFVYRKFIEVK